MHKLLNRSSVLSIVSFPSLFLALTNDSILSGYVNSVFHYVNLYRVYGRPLYTTTKNATHM